MTTARDIMNAGATCIGEDQTLMQAAQMMRDMNVGSLPICGNDEDVGSDLRRAEEAVQRRIDPAALVDSVAERRVCVVVPRLELHELELVRRIAVHLVRREKDERRLRAALPNRFQQVERAHRVDVEVVERAARRKVVRRLSRTVNDEIRARTADERRHTYPFTNVDVVVLEARRHLM